jgi:hypothetical protein
MKFNIISYVGIIPVIEPHDQDVTSDGFDFDKQAFEQSPSMEFFIRPAFKKEQENWPKLSKEQRYYLLVNNTSPHCRAKVIFSRTTANPFSGDDLLLCDRAESLIMSLAPMGTSSIYALPYPAGGRN